MNTEKEIVNKFNFANRQKNIKHLMQLRDRHEERLNHAERCGYKIAFWKRRLKMIDDRLAKLKSI